jgi:hypothetical protein
MSFLSFPLESILSLIFVSFNSNITRQKNRDAKIIHILLCIVVLKIV